MIRLALVTTVRNESATIPDLLASIAMQTRSPDEIVVADGGSDDGTLEIARAWAGAHENARVISAPGANISRGRNAAIESTDADVIAVTDAGCVLDQRWLEHLAAAIESGADVAMGYYQPLATTPFEQIATCITVPDVSEIDPAKFMPSSRSVAFRREVWERSGRYPVWLDVGEDMFFNFRTIDSGAKRTFVPDAIVSWRPRRTLRDFVRQYFSYAKGDAIGRMYPHRHAIRFGTYLVAAILIVLSVRWPVAAVLPAGAAVVWLAAAYRRAFRRLKSHRMLALAAIPFIVVVMDAAKMAGYIAGLGQRKAKGWTQASSS